jgi:hypothetical protein
MWNAIGYLSFISLIFERHAFQPSIINLIFNIQSKLELKEYLKLKINIHPPYIHHKV